MLLSRKTRVAFVLDQQVGLRTQSLNFERFVPLNPDIDPIWIPVHYEAKDAGLLTRIPGVPGSIRGTLRGVHEIRTGLRDAGQWDAALWSSWAAKSVPELVLAKPAFLRMDMTPNQMEAMGDHYGYTKKRAQFLGNWKRRATERIYNGATHFFPWNPWVAQSLRDDWAVPAEKITPVSPGVDTELFRPNPEVKPSDGVVRLLFVGGDFLRKGGDQLLRWARTDGAQLHATHPWEIHFVTRDRQPEGGDSSNNLKFHHGIANNSDELVRLYQSSDIFVLPTRADCYSLVALEAMACGLPVVITDIGGISGIVSKETGYLLSNESDDSCYSQLADILHVLITSGEVRAGMGILARNRAVAEFEVRDGIQRMIRILKETLAP